MEVLSWFVRDFDSFFFLCSKSLTSLLIRISRQRKTIIGLQASVRILSALLQKKKQQYRQNQVP